MQALHQKQKSDKTSNHFLLKRILASKVVKELSGLPLKGVIFYSSPKMK